MAVGLMVNGPYALITTAVSTELGTHKSLKGSARALATVTAIIDGTGSIGNERYSQMMIGIVSNVLFVLFCFVLFCFFLKKNQGAAVGPLMAGAISDSGWQYVFYMLMASDIIALLVK